MTGRLAVALAIHPEAGARKLGLAIKVISGISNSISTEAPLKGAERALSEV